MINVQYDKEVVVVTDDDKVTLIEDKFVNLFQVTSSEHYTDSVHDQRNANF